MCFVRCFLRTTLQSKISRASFTEQADFDNGIFFPPEFVVFERIIAMDPPDEHCDEDSYLVKWQGLGYEHCTWETQTTVDKEGAQAQVQQYHEANASATAAPISAITDVGGKVKNDQALTDRIGKLPLRSSRSLRSYQQAGVQWLTFNWHNGRNSILADEMGLGKTVQTVATLTYCI